METEISIIIPVYNLEQLLRRCVDSVLAQTFSSFELILVNDGSTDNSGEICDDYARMDDRIKVIHKKNGGVASSRNAGLEIAKGKFIGFVDNDDYINEHMFEMLYNHANKYNSDIVICDYVEVYEEQCSISEVVQTDYKIQQLSNMDALHQLYEEKAITFIVPWNKIYRRHLFENLRYKVGIINDDESVVHELFYYANQLTYIHAGLYYYVQRNESQTGNFHIKQTDIIYALKAREQFFKKKKELELHQKTLEHYMEKFFWNYYMARTYLTDVDIELKNLKQTFDSTLISLLKLKGIGSKRKIMFILFWIHPSIFYVAEDLISKQKKKVV